MSSSLGTSWGRVARGAQSKGSGPSSVTGLGKRTFRPRSDLSSIAAIALVVLVWLLLEISVQPWSRADGVGGSDSNGLAKGAMLIACVLVLVVALPPRTRFHVPAPAIIYLSFMAVVILSASLLPGTGTIVVRAGRIMAGIMVIVLMFPLVRERLGGFLSAVIGVHAFLGLSVLAGLVLSPGQAWFGGRGFGAGGRLMGSIMPMMPPRVGEIGAILVGLAMLMWANRKMAVVLAIPLVLLGIALVFLSRTRTAPLATLIGLIISALVSLGSHGGRRLSLALGAGALASLPFVPAVLSWALRGQSDSQLEKLSGRTHVWDFILGQPSTAVQLWFGRGLGEKRILLRRGEGDINYMAIDNSWLDAYWETGIVGVIFVAVAVLFTFILAIRTPDRVARTFATFLVTYVLVASVNESGLCDLSSMTLLLFASVLVSQIGRQSKDSLPTVHRGPIHHHVAPRGRK